MSKILLTGMSAAQASRKANARTLSFAGVLEKSLTNAGHEVLWEVPSIGWTKEFLSQFDSVVVGISPLTSLSANYCYGGLHVITELLDDKRLTLLVDSPQPGQITASLKSITANPQAFTKDFYTSRQGFQQASQDAVRTRLLATIERLLTATWPTTIYPSLPWQDALIVSKQFAESASQKLVGINLDAELLVPANYQVDRRLKWSADSSNSPWTQKVSTGLVYPVSLMKWNKGWADDLVEEQIARSTGVLITPHKKDGTWWTYRYIQAMNTTTPIASLWTETVKIGESWGNLAANIEALSQDERNTIATKQREEYLSAIPSLDDAHKNLHKTLGITKRKAVK
jgi:hypothetical protein